MTERSGTTGGEQTPAGYVLITHDSEPGVLLLPDGPAWRPPRFALPPGHFADVGPVTDAIRESMGLDAAVLRTLRIDSVGNPDGPARVYEVEQRTPGWRPPAVGRWVDREEARRLALEPRALAPVVRDHAAGTPHPLRVPWARRGWFREASGWVHRQLDALGYQPTGPLRQVRCWSVSSVMSVPTRPGLTYFKASPAVFARETALTGYLSRSYPGGVPQVLAEDVERRWMLTADLGPSTLGDVDDLRLEEDALRLLATVQMDQASQVEALATLGCPDRGLGMLRDQIDPLFADTDSTMLGRPGGLLAEQLRRLRTAAPRLKEMCSDLASFAIPMTLEHGDLDSGNVFVKDGRPVLMDWSDGSVSHPFFSLTSENEVSERGPALRDAYLEQWTAYESADRLVRAYDLSVPLGALHRAVGYQRYILPQMEPSSRWELEEYVPRFLRQLLRVLG